MTKFNGLLIAAIAAFQVSGLSFGQKVLRKNESSIPLPDSTIAGTLTIVRIKTPWYAWRRLIVSKMKTSIPQYQNIAGLQYKYFSIGGNNKTVGGLYFWEKEDLARKWFNEAWFKRTEKKYGEKGRVQFFSVDKIITYKNDKKMDGALAVLTYTNGHELEIKQTVEGVITFVTLKDEANEICYLTCWGNKNAADAFFATRRFANEYFETPMFLNNAR